MAYERIMGLNVINDEMYQKYRDAMTPILTMFGGSFGYDFKVAEVLKSKTSDHINRVFTIEFPNQSAMEAFFTAPDYLVVQQQYFNRSVKSKTTISLHEVNDI
jgi:uncharacterized protein (DUF1330 family)